MLNSFLHKITDFIGKEHLLDNSAKYLVALSGGADSVAMLLAMKRLNYDIEAVHCNFHLRGEESNRDESFCENLCKEQIIPFHRAHFDTKTYAELHHISIEMAARELRYNYFEKLRAELGCAGICVAHHRDDNAETLLLNICRGTGIHGLCGMKARNGYVLRPMLCVTRIEIVNFLDFIGQKYVDDSTNFHADVQRNKIRLEVLPLLKSINPSVVDTLLQMSENINNASYLLDNSTTKMTEESVIEKSDNHIVYSLDLFKKYEYLLFAVLTQYGFNSAQVSQIYNCLDSQPGKEWESASHVALIDRNTFIIYTRTCIYTSTIDIPVEGKYIYEDQLRLSVKNSTRTSDFTISKKENIATLDADSVKVPLTLRPVANGDCFYPFGMNGKKLVSDYMTDCKLSLFDKKRQLVVTDATGKIIWLVGKRTDNRCRISDRTTHILTLSIC